MDKTTTVLTIDLPGDLSARLRRALRERPGRSVNEIAIEALEEWLARHGPAGETTGETPEP